MPAEGIQHRSHKRRLTFVLVPEGESKKTRTLSIGRPLLFGLISLAVLLVVACTLVIVVFTPAGTYLPIPNPELENRYGKRIVQIQEQLRSLSSEMVMLQEYNLRLRKVLGESVAHAESSYSAGRIGTRNVAPGVAARDAASGSTTGARAPMQPSIDDVMMDPGVARISGPGRLADSRNYENFPLSLPTLGYFTREFSSAQGHFGIDIAGKEGSPILAAASGVVTFADWTYDYGYVLQISHPGGYMTVYKHNMSLLKSPGSVVKRGEIIGLLGNTGQISSGPHLHFEVWRDGLVLDPNNYLIASE